MQSKQAKTPPLSNRTKLLCFDIETNKLHGEAFAVGAVIMGADGRVSDQFTGRTKIVGPIDPWIEQNILPAVQRMPITHRDAHDLREGFWEWFVHAQETADYVLVNNGYPVEYRFLLKCQEENLEERYWQHPFPILDLFSLTIQAGDMRAIKAKLRSEADSELVLHNPLHDAILSAKTAFAAFELSGRI
jgi:hypothetical protein